MLNDSCQIYWVTTKVRRCSGVMGSAVDSGLIGPGLSPRQGHYIVFLGKTLNSHTVSLYPGM